MRASLGVSAGSEIVCSTLMVSTADGDQRFDYRVISADEANADLGELIASAIDLMTTQVPRETLQLSGIAVGYRDRDQTHSIRSAVGTQRRDLRLVPESAAALRYLQHTGDISHVETVGICDFGATGLTVTVLDAEDGEVLESQRTEAISGNAIDELVYHLLARRHNIGERGRRPNRGMLLVRGRAAKEHLSTSPVVTIDHVAGRPVELTRDDLEHLISGLLYEAADFVGKVIANARCKPELLAVIGGSANIPAVSSVLAHQLGISVLAVDEPEAAIAKGAALLADSSQPLSYPVVSLAADAPVGTFTKVAGTLVGVAVVVGLIVAYGVQALTSGSQEGVSPAGTTVAPPPLTSPVLPITTAPSPLPLPAIGAPDTRPRASLPAERTVAPTTAPRTTLPRTTAPIPTTAATTPTRAANDTSDANPTGSLDPAPSQGAPEPEPARSSPENIRVLPNGALVDPFAAPLQ